MPLARCSPMEAAERRTLGQLSRASAGGMTFDVETEAQLHEPPQVRTYVFLEGRIVDRVVWEFQATDSEAGARLVRLQHDSVLKQINKRMKHGMPEDDPRVIGTLPPPAPPPSASPSETRLIESIRPIPTDDVADDVPLVVALPPLMAPLLLAPAATFVPAPTRSVSIFRPDPRVPFASGAVIDDDATALVEVGEHAAAMANVAFLAAGLDALLTQHLSLGPCEHILIDTRTGPVMVVREGSLTAAFSPERKGPIVKVVAEVRMALGRLAEEEA